MPDKPDCPELNKEKQSSCYEIVSVFQEQFSLRDENERDYYQFKSVNAGLFANGYKKKLSSTASGTDTVKDKISELCALYQNLNAG